MNLYVVVHHRKDQNQPWANSWLDDDCIQVIQTTKEIGQLCSSAKEQSQKVFVHRCGWGNEKPIISCSVDVERVDSVDKKTSLVWFCNPEATHREPTTTLFRGRNYYFEE